MRHLGADVVDSLDASDFEGATVVHDLNLPAPTTLVGRYTAVIDAGTMEHVFNVPEALRTAMSLVAQGGHLVLMAPCNNNPGHGFYQFTPELVYRSLSTSNGFVVVRCLLKEVRGRWYDVADPASLGRRREFRTRRSTYLFVVAERVADVPIFAEWPQQRDYELQWAGTTSSPAPHGTTQLLARRGPIWRIARAARARMYPPNYRLCRDQFTVVVSPPGAVSERHARRGR